jgi:molybdopterin/thiamine biosynthesis adenylyltransferase
MDILQKKLKVNSADVLQKPIFFELQRAKDRKALNDLIKTKAVQSVIDDYMEQQRELFAIKNPTMAQHPDFEAKFQDHILSITKKVALVDHGVWVYFPWLSTVVHILKEDDFQIVRTARNRYLINEEEQKKFYNAVIGIAGLSVGSNVALAIVLQGGGKHIRLADHDRLALSNTNRIRSGVQNLGLLKVEMVARQIYEMNPYSTVEIFTEGLNPDNIKRFFEGPAKLDIVIDEVDHLGMKYLIREHAQKNRLAVVMAADNGDSAVVDVERYDKNFKTKFFHGRLGDVSYESLSSLKKFEIGKMITKHVGPENVTERMRQSLLELGKTIVSWPQLGGAATMSGASVAYCVRKILNDQPVIDNRAIVSLDEKLVPNYNSAAEEKKRVKTANEFRKIFGL